MQFMEVKMKYFTNLLLTLGMFLNVVFYNPGILAQRPADKFERRVYHSDNDSIQYRLFVPTENISSGSYPLILTLHGLGECGSDNDRQIITHRIAETWAEDSSQQKHPAFILSPQIPKRSNNLDDLWEYLPSYWFTAIDSLLDLIILKYPIDTTRIYLTGLSLGALNTWWFIYNTSPNRFAAAIPLSGGWLGEWLPKNVEPQITNIPIWIFCGSLDFEWDMVHKVRNMILNIENAGLKVVRKSTNYGDVGLTITEIDSLNTEGITHIYTEFINGSHENVYDLTYDDPVLHHWLFSQSKNSNVSDINSQQITDIRTQYKLYNNYPNPFNPSTTIKYSVPYSVISNERSDVRNLNDSKISPYGRNDNMNVTLRIYDILGREISTLVNQKQNPGNYEVTWDASNVPSGVYFYQLTSGNFVKTKKMILLR